MLPFDPVDGRTVCCILAKELAVGACNVDDGLVRGFVSDAQPLDATDVLAKLCFFAPRDDTLDDVAEATDERVPIDETFILVVVVVVFWTEPPVLNGGRGDRDRELGTLEDTADVVPFSTFRRCPLVDIRVFDPLDLTIFRDAVFAST